MSQPVQVNTDPPISNQPQQVFGVDAIRIPSPLDKDYTDQPSYPTVYKQKYEVDRFSLVTGISIVGNIAMGQLFGVGIKRAEANLKEKEFRSTDYKVPSIFPDYPDALPNAAGGYDRTIGWDGRMSSALAGMPVMCYLKIKGGTYTDLKGNQQTIPDIIFETVVITLDLNKVMEKTPIQGRDTGRVKEAICLDDWSIEIRVIVTADAPVNNNVTKRNQSGVYPRDNVAEIWKALKAPIALPIECWYLQQFDINYIAIDRVGIQQVEGEYSMQRFVIQAFSDNPLIITIAS